MTLELQEILRGSFFGIAKGDSIQSIAAKIGEPQISTFANKARTCHLHRWGPLSVYDSPQNPGIVQDLSLTCVPSIPFGRPEIDKWYHGVQSIRRIDLPENGKRIEALCDDTQECIFVEPHIELVFMLPETQLQKVSYWPESIHNKSKRS